MTTRPRSFTARSAGLPALAALALCLAFVAPPADAAARGDCLSMTTVIARTPSQIDAMVATFGTEAQLYPAATCGATQYNMTYQTIAPDGRAAVASAGVIVPTGCAAPFPLVEYNHGTWPMINMTMTDPVMHTPQTVMAQFGATGYAAVMPDYLGYGASTLGYHPYLNADSNAAVTMDAVRAVRACLASGGTLNSKLFLTGTSEGGYVTLATQRAMEASGLPEFKIAAAVATSGPYALADTMMSMLQVGDGVPGYAQMQLTGYQKTYGDVYAATTDVFQNPYATEPGFDTLLPSVTSMARLTRSGQLPSVLEGNNGLLTAAFVNRYLTNPLEPARLRSQQNDLLNFAPKRPLSLCYGSADPHAMANAQQAATFFATQGVAVATSDIQAVPSYKTFIAQMAGKDYHSNVEAPACVAWARQYVFDPLRTGAGRKQSARAAARHALGNR